MAGMADGDNRFRREMIRVAVVDGFGSLLLGLGLYARYGAGEGTLPAPLNNPSMVNAMLTAGIVLIGWGSYRMITLAMARSGKGR